ncbi:MAG: cupredoxin domain-containing protein [Deltaproteobacteria bacterium]|nr:cupredoxin domain-containing protein [Deltaproteobacteria bacterium]MBZ0219774.1 cupredoxin domain-containing protein [Deltaproteobacteria bacterium]
MRHFLITVLMIALGAVPALSQPEGDAYEARIGPDWVQRAEVAAGSYYFRPGHIIVKAGVPVELELKSEALIIPHDFIINAPEAGIEVSEELTRKPVFIRFTPTKAGKYPFHCGKDFPFQKSHREKGMEGVLEVVP